MSRQVDERRGREDDRLTVIAVAPVAHVGHTLPAGVRNPVTPQEVAAETIACARAGASVVHLHVRDDRGNQTADRAWFTRTLDLIRAHSDIVINGSTGGVADLSLEERCVSLDDPRVEVGSLNMGSVNFGDSVYINTVPDIRFWAARMRERRVVPELEVFNPSMITTAIVLRDEGVLDDPLHFNFCLGFPGAIAADYRQLVFLVSLLPDGCEWGLIHEGMRDLSLVSAALGMGARVLRVGFEDGPWVRRDRPARSNAELVDNLVALVRAAGKEPATPADARRLIGTAVDA
ncbi:MAG: 3-keto-5-aminohexanoate cleavage protein [Spirochaetaceae bacterium]|nr:MAG: 3-keto-5-aminohexanoate cleavage protein [Spirochaetaceae bacterium]